MARKFVSPGVFTQEIDRSFLAQGVANIGAAVIGVTAQGPAFAPYTVSDFNGFVAAFGDVDPEKQLPYAAQNYLKNSDTLNVVRVLGSRDGKSNVTNGWDHVPVLLTGVDGEVLAELHILSGTTLTILAENAATALVSGVLFTSVLPGASGNSVTVQYSLVAGATTASAAGNAITVGVHSGTYATASFYISGANGVAISSSATGSTPVYSVSVVSGAIVGGSASISSGAITITTDEGNTDAGDLVRLINGLSGVTAALIGASGALVTSPTSSISFSGSRQGNEGEALAALSAAGADVSGLVLVASGTGYVSGTNAGPSAVVSLSGGGINTAPAFIFSGSAGAAFTGVFSGNLSFITSSLKYVGLVLNSDPTKADAFGHYLFKNFKWAQTSSVGFAPIGIAAISGVAYTGAAISFVDNTASVGSGSSAAYDYDWTTPRSPEVKSQYGDQLFYFETIADGASANVNVKVTIANIKASSFPAVTKFGTFDVIIRDFNDTDLRQAPLETFTNCTLDPSSANYLPRVIGDQYAVWDSTARKNFIHGTFKNVSKYVLVHMGDGNWDPTALPWGHSGYSDAQSALGAAGLIDVPVIEDNLDAFNNLAVYVDWGVDLSQDNVADRLKAWPHHNLASYASLVAGADFSLLHISGSSTLGGVDYSVYNTAFTGNMPAINPGVGTNSFTVAFQGGFDGWDLTNADPVPTGSINNADIAVTALKLAIDTLSNPDDIDLNLLALPGVTEPMVTSYAELMCNNRADCMYIMDIDGASVVAAVGNISSRAIDDNYTATYYPDLWLADNTNNVQVKVKPSVAVLGAYAYSDRVGQVFFAPAGLNRGGLAAFNIVDVVDRLTFQDRNDLYEARINPIASFPSEGIVVFGQKTLQAQPSALDRVNVRRLLIFAKKTIASAAKYLLFEQNNAATWQRFLNTVNPILQTIQQNQGLERFKVVMDTTTNTPDLIDRNIMTGKIFLQPTKAAEFIDLSFIITASGVAFEE